MPIKHQSKCYRTINGHRYVNYSDLIYSDEENQIVLEVARTNYSLVRKIKHPSGYYQVFVANRKV